ncbi:MAG: hypothetical protein ACJAY8_000871 [Sphingobacteriales bacterium]|jgi:hypothetical protein
MASKHGCFQSFLARGVLCISFGGSAISGFAFSGVLDKGSSLRITEKISLIA